MASSSFFVWHPEKRRVEKRMAPMRNLNRVMMGKLRRDTAVGKGEILGGFFLTAVARANLRASRIYYGGS
jgi:hypothetical protein